tara:strand:+ start:4990 stop:5307 length:318 start_codon:yes stop_codon:yes gene_type:complete
METHRMDNKTNYASVTKAGLPDIAPRNQANNGFTERGQQAAANLLKMGRGHHTIGRFEYNRNAQGSFRLGVQKVDLYRELTVIQRKDGNFVNMYVMYKDDVLSST